MRIVAIIQARTQSTRLPGKVLADVCGQTLIERTIRRVMRCEGIEAVVVAHPNQSARILGPIVPLAKGEFKDRLFTWGHPGDQNDVLSRIYSVARNSWPPDTTGQHSDAILRVCGDCPLWDAEVASYMVQLFQSSDADYMCLDVDVPQLAYLGSAKFPEGIDAEIFKIGLLRRACEQAEDDYDREHVTTWFRTPAGPVKPEFDSGGIPSDRDYSGLKWSVDTAEDLEFVRAVYAHFDGRDDFGLEEITDWIKANPEVQKINGQTWEPNKWEMTENQSESTQISVAQPAASSTGRRTPRKKTAVSATASRRRGSRTWSKPSRRKECKLPRSPAGASRTPKSGGPAGSSRKKRSRKKNSSDKRVRKETKKRKRSSERLWGFL